MKGHSHPHSALVLVLFLLLCCCCCIAVLLLESVSVPSHSDSDPKKKGRYLLREEGKMYGRVGEMMVAMLPPHLPFTLFLPLQDTILLQSNFSSSNEDDEQVRSIVSRVMGFSAVPHHLQSWSVAVGGEEVQVQSLSGLTLHLSRVPERDGGVALVVNGLRCVATDMKRGQTIIHVVRGIVLDAEFRQSLFQ